MSEKVISFPAAKPLSRPERRRLAKEARKKILSKDERKMLVQDGFSTLCQLAGLRSLMRLMEQDIDLACGVKGKWEQNPAGRTGYRNGWGAGAVWAGGAWVQIDRPRAIRKDGSEIELESYKAAQNPEFLSNAALTATVLGVSLREHAKVVGAINPLGPDFQISGLSKSTIGRRFQEAADEFVSMYMQRPLDERYLVVWVDAVAEGDYSVLAAVGLAEDGTKKVLSLRQGSTENSEFCVEFLEHLMARGLSAKQGLLWAVDGGTGMLKALREVFGKDVLIQRCQVHKHRNVIEKLTLPAPEKEAIIKKLEAAWAIEEPVLAKASLELLVKELEASGQMDAARSLQEGLPEMLTCCRLGVPPELMASLTNTNVIESTFSVHEKTARRVKRWRNGKQVLRWVAVSSRRAEKAFRKVGTPESLARLASKLERYALDKARTPRIPALTSPVSLAIAS